MIYLVADTYLVGNPKHHDEDTAIDGEPVIPSFPMGMISRFLAIKSRGSSFRAKARELDEDPNALLEVLATTYPGLPRPYLTDILVDTLAAAAKLDRDRIYRPLILGGDATLQDTDDSTILIPIWKDRDTRKYI